MRKQRKSIRETLRKLQSLTALSELKISSLLFFFPAPAIQFDYFILFHQLFQFFIFY